MAIGSTGQGPEVLPSFFIERFHNERVKNKIKLKVLVNDTVDGRDRMKEFKKLSLVESKFLPKTHQSPATIYIYGNKSAIVMWLAPDKPFAILIENKEISNSFRNYFELLWKTAK